MICVTKLKNSPRNMTAGFFFTRFARRPTKPGRHPLACERTDPFEEQVGKGLFERVLLILLLQ